MGSTILIRSIEQLMTIKTYTKAMEHAQAKVELIEADSNNLNMESLQSLQKMLRKTESPDF